MNLARLVLWPWARGRPMRFSPGVAATSGTWPALASAVPSPRSPGHRARAWRDGQGHPGGAGVNLVNLEKVVKGYGPRVLLDGVSAGAAAGGERRRGRS
jgi:hypothetical protein